MTAGRPYWSPYVAGIALGLIVAATYVLMGYGPGASGAFAHVAARLEDTLAPARVAGNAFVAGYLESGRLWAQWVVVVLGVGFAIGGYWPGSSAVGAASGRVDAVAFMAGLVAGVWVFAEAYVALAGFVWSGDLGTVTFVDLLGVPFWALAGLPVAGYDRSWIEWGNRDDLPVAR